METKNLVFRDRGKADRRRHVAQSEADIAKFERLGRVGDVTLADRDADVERIAENAPSLPIPSS